MRGWGGGKSQLTGEVLVGVSISRGRTSILQRTVGVGWRAGEQNIGPTESYNRDMNLSENMLQARFTLIYDEKFGVARWESK